MFEERLEDTVVVIYEVTRDGCRICILVDIWHSQESVRLYVDVVLILKYVGKP